MSQAYQVFGDVTESEISSKELGYSMIDQHQKSTKEILESSLTTFEDGKELLASIKEISNKLPGLADKNRTSKVCCSIEHLLETLNEKRVYLEELWKNRKSRLEYCIQISNLRQRIKQVMEMNETVVFNI